MARCNLSLLSRSEATESIQLQHFHFLKTNCPLLPKRRYTFLSFLLSNPNSVPFSLFTSVCSVLFPLFSLVSLSSPTPTYPNTRDSKLRILVLWWL